MTAFKLSICMATRNRAAFIGETLESILSQATEEVEVVVLDGASTDDTEQVVQHYRDRFPRLRYIRQETNTGIDRDFNNAVEQAQGEYCWLFCDDDLIKPGAIRRVLDAIENDYSLIIANSEVRNADLSKLLEERKVPLTADRVYPPDQNYALLGDAGAYMSFIGGVILKRQLWTARPKEEYFGSYFIHMGVIFQAPLPGNALVLAEPMIEIRYANASWLARYFEIWMFKWPGLVWSFAGIPDSAKALVCARDPWRSPKTLLHYRASGSYSIREYTEWIRPRLAPSPTRALAWAAARCPGRLANLLAFLYYGVFRRPSSRLLLLLDLENSPNCFWKFSEKRPGPPKAPPTPRTAELRLAPRAADSTSKSLDI